MHDLLARIREVVDKAQNNISFFVFCVLEVCVDLFVPFDYFSNVSGSRISHMVCSSSGTRVCVLTCFLQTSQAGHTPGAQLGENTYTLE